MDPDDLTAATIPAPPPFVHSPIGADVTQETHPEDLAWALHQLDSDELGE